MNEQEKQSIKTVLEAALHNQKVVQDQLSSLYNPKDKSFPDWDMRQTVNREVAEAIKAIEDALKEVERA